MHRGIGLFLLALALTHCPAPKPVEPRPLVPDAGQPGSGGTAAVSEPDAAPVVAVPEPGDAASPSVVDAAVVVEHPKPDASCALRVLGRSYGRAACRANSDCGVVTLECCPPCGVMRRDSVRAVAVGQLAPVCSMACPACVAMPPADLGAACISGRCQLVQDPCAHGPNLLEQMSAPVP